MNSFVKEIDLSMVKPLRILVFILTAFTLTVGKAQRKSKNKNKTEPVEVVETPPKLIVGIVIDQMPSDILTRFWNHFGDQGFKRMLNDGFYCKNHHLNQGSIGTGPGHASIYTGTVPASHGIIGDYWFDSEVGDMVNSVTDDGFQTIGTSSLEGNRSPHRLLGTTITDVLRMHTQLAGKTMAIALNDKAAVLSGGHSANAAYWLDGGIGNWISSSYYMQSLPAWVVDFNASGTVQTNKKAWNTLKPIASYAESRPDNRTSEGLFESEIAPVFPHSTPKLLSKTSDFELLQYTPYGNSLTTDFALAALRNEALGMDDATDFLAISFSSTLAIGHMFGVNSKEVQDTFVRLDQELARLFIALDEQVGKGGYTVFLTAGHAVNEDPAKLKSQKKPSENSKTAENNERFNDYLKYRYGTTDIVKNISNNQLYLDHRVIGNLDMELKDVQEEIAFELLRYGPVGKVYTGYQMWQNEFIRGLPFVLQNGWHQKRSGDILVVQKPGFLEFSKSEAAGDFSISVDDTHVPLLFFGNGIQQGKTVTRTEVSDIAPTISSLLGIPFPKGATGNPIGEALE